KVPPVAQPVAQQDPAAETPATTPPSVIGGESPVAPASATEPAQTPPPPTATPEANAPANEAQRSENRPVVIPPSTGGAPGQNGEDHERAWIADFRWQIEQQINLPSEIRNDAGPPDPGPRLGMHAAGPGWKACSQARTTSVVHMRDVQRLAIVDPSDSTREPLRNLLLGVESVWLEAECFRYEFFFDVVHQSNPDVAVVALDAGPTKALQPIPQLSAEVPGLPILAVSAKGDGQSILQALRSGAREFLTQPVVLEELLTALQRLRQNRTFGDNGAGGAVVKTDAQVIAVLGS